MNDKTHFISYFTNKNKLIGYKWDLSDWHDMSFIKMTKQESQKMT